MIQLDEKQVQDLLTRISNPEDRQNLAVYLNELLESSKGQEEEANFKMLKHKRARQALEIISKAGIEVFKHVAIDKLLHLLD